MNNAMESLSTWMRFQEQLFSSWMDIAQNIPNIFQETGVFNKGFAGPSEREFKDFFDSCSQVFNGSFMNMPVMGAEVIQNTLSRLTGKSNAFIKLYETWHPIFQALQDRISDEDAYRELLDPTKYQEVMDELFGFSTDVVTEIMGESAKFNVAFCHTANVSGHPWLEAAEQNFQLSPEFVEGRSETFLRVFHNLFTAFDDSFGKVFHIPAVGKDREKIGLMMRCCDDLLVFHAKRTEFQHRIYVTGIKAMNKVLEAIGRSIKSGKEIKTFNELFDLWIEVNEREFAEVFRTEKFSRMQGELLDCSLKIRRDLHKLMELYLFDFPIALRSEMDDIYKTVYDLKKKVKSLEKQLRDVTTEEAAA